MAGVDEQGIPFADDAAEDQPVHVNIEVPEESSQDAQAPESAPMGEGATAPVEPADGEPDEEAMARAAQAAGEAAAHEEMAADEAANYVVLQAERDDLAERVEGAEARAAEATDRLARLQAEWENFRKRTAAERLAERERATEKLVTNLLPVIDDLERAVEHANQGADAQADDVAAQLASGVDAVRAKLVDVLAKEGVEVIDPAGEAFDPLEHQAVGRAEDPSVYDETVRDVYQRGYRMGGKVIRPAMVTVTFGGEKRPAPADDATEANEDN